MKGSRKTVTVTRYIQNDVVADYVTAVTRVFKTSNFDFCADVTIFLHLK
jgi:hypothetical protein